MALVKRQPPTPKKNYIYIIRDAQYAVNGSSVSVTGVLRITVGGF